MIWYRFGLKTGIRKLWFPIATIPSGQDFFLPVAKRNDYPIAWRTRLLQDAGKIISGNLLYYSHHWKEIGNPPNWFLNPFNGKSYPDPHLHFTKLPDFHPAVGDIKNIWEASRFEWVVTLARAYAITADEKYLLTLNTWLRDWAKHNPLNAGPNWKCGQEASIRVFNLLLAAFILNQELNSSKALVNLVAAHLKRIKPNILYAIAQDNNHGTSEAAGLLLGGTWLASQDAATGNQYNKYIRKGRKWLENRLNKLVASDGSFSQHSVNYHRVLVDTLSFVEFFRVHFNQAPFSEPFLFKTQKAIEWLTLFTNPVNGYAPLIGANDGARLLNLTSTTYRDCRPSVQFANALFNKTIIFEQGFHDEPLYWLKVSELSSQKVSLKPGRMLSGGYTILQKDEITVFIRWPWFRFRPSHNDVMHMDVWYKGENVLPDAGTYSYNPDEDLTSLDLKSVRYHNTVSFDNEEQMPKISRFLLGNWLKPISIGKVDSSPEGAVTWVGSYKDNIGNFHQRKVTLIENQVIIEDTLSGSFHQAVISYNLNMDNVELEENRCQTNLFLLTFSPELIAEMSNGFLSQHYQAVESIQQLRLKARAPGSYTTRIKFYDNAKQDV